MRDNCLALWRDSLNSNGQQFHQYQQNKQINSNGQQFHQYQQNEQLSLIYYVYNHIFNYLSFVYIIDER
jgi:malic enzyme